MNQPDPNGPKPPGVSDSAWYGYTKVDSSKPIDWWGAMDQYSDPNAQGYERYKSDKVDAQGNAIQGLFEHPDACPPGTTALGQNQCVSIDDPRIKAAWGDQSQSSMPGLSAQPQLSDGQQYQQNQQQNQTQQQSPNMSTQQNTMFSTLGGWGQSPNPQIGAQAQPQNSGAEPSSIPGFSTPFQQKQQKPNQPADPQNNRSAFGYARQY